MVISRGQLDERFRRIDGLLNAIVVGETALDPLLGGTAVFSPSSLFPPNCTGKAAPRSESALARLLAERIASERRARGWRQMDLAEATGIARPNIARLESGRRMPKIGTLHRIAQALEITLEEMMG